VIHHHHHHHHRGAGCGSTIVAFTIAALIVWTVENAWPYLLALGVLAALVLGARERRRQADPEPAPSVTRTIDGHTAGLRMTDTDREQVADALQGAGADGRLDPDELEQRLTAAYAAKKWAEIAPLVEDLDGWPVSIPTRK